MSTGSMGIIRTPIKIKMASLGSHRLMERVLRFDLLLLSGKWSSFFFNSAMELYQLKEVQGLTSCTYACTLINNKTQLTVLGVHCCFLVPSSSVRCCLGITTKEWRQLNDESSMTTRTRGQWDDASEVKTLVRRRLLFDECMAILAGLKQPDESRMNKNDDGGTTTMVRQLQTSSAHCL